MLRELTRDDWLEMLAIPADRIPQVAILRGTRNLRKFRDIHAERFDNVLDLGSPNGLFEDIFLGTYRSLNIGYASVYGDSMASEMTHLFAAIGTRLVIQTGCCGGLQQGVQTGDLIIPRNAVPGEGAAQYYTADPEKLYASAEIIRKTASLVRSSCPYHTGVMFTTSALLAEGKTELESWRDAGYVAVDMETATTFAVAKSFNMQRVGISFVFDNPLYGDTLVQTDDERTARRQQGEDAMLEVTTRLLDHLNETGFE